MVAAIYYIGTSINDVTCFSWLFEPFLTHAITFLLLESDNCSSISDPSPLHPIRWWRYLWITPRAAPTTLYASSEHIMGVKLEQPLLSLVIEQFEFCGAVVKVSMNLMLFATMASMAGIAKFWPKINWSFFQLEKVKYHLLWWFRVYIG